MRTLIILLSCSLFVTNLNAQKDSILLPPPTPNDNYNSGDPIFTKVEVEAEFPGGLEGWKKFLMTNLDVDGVAKKVKVPRGKKEVIETVIVKFIVSKTGSISSIGIENEECNEACKAEAIRVIKKSPNWIPAQQNGRKVNAYRRQPITFVISK